MKKLLLASAAMALSAGVASAQGVTISGDARMGLEYDDGRAEGNVANVQMTSRARVIFTLSGQSDSGFTFGASFRADNAGASAGNRENTGSGVFVSGAFGRLTIGDAAGAARARVGDLAFTSLTGLGDPNEMSYLDRIQQSTSDVADIFEIGDPLLRRTAARYDYTFDAFTFSVSMDQIRKFEGLEIGGDTYDTVKPRGWAIGASYNFGIGNVSIGYEELRIRVEDEVLDDESVKATHLILGADATFEGITVKGIYGRAGSDLGDFLRDNDLSRNQYGLSVTGSFDMVTASAFYRKTFFKDDVFGIGASYDVGGGASIVGSLAYIDPNEGDSRTRADLGVAMRF